jgi:hypothetical protein
VKIAGILTGKGGGSNVYLNDTTYWRNVPANVWEYTIGGYQVIKKWLSYREQALLGRTLSTDEACEVTHMARRIAAIVLLYSALDTNYEEVAWIKANQAKYKGKWIVLLGNCVMGMGDDLKTAMCMA